MYRQAECGQLLYSGRFDAALEASRIVQSRYRTEDHGTIFLDTGSDPLIGVFTADANVHALRNDIPAATASFEKAMTHVESIGAELQTPWVLVFTGSALTYTPGTEELSLDRLRTGCDIADAQGSEFWSLNGRLWQSVAASERGEPEQGDLELIRLIEAQNSVGIGLNRPLFLAVHAQDLHRNGESEQARELAVKATRMASSFGQGQWASEIWRKRANIHWDLGENDTAQRCWDIALAYARRSGAVLWEQRCRSDLERLQIR